ncbi:MAG: flavin reductase family protein [Aggregatilineales bacterium]
MDDNTFKEALRQWVAGVTIVTTRVGDQIQGMTASSFTSVSINPHLILIAVDDKTRSQPLISESGIFAANILHTGQIEWAKRFAGMYPEITDRFFDIDYTTATTGAPILPGVIGWVDCKVYGEHKAGDHTIFVGEVIDAQGSGGEPPLLYYSRQWGHFSAVPEEN